MSIERISQTLMSRQGESQEGQEKKLSKIMKGNQINGLSKR